MKQQTNKTNSKTYYCVRANSRFALHNAIIDGKYVPKSDIADSDSIAPVIKRGDMFSITSIDNRTMSIVNLSKNRKWKECVLDIKLMPYFNRVTESKKPPRKHTLEYAGSLLNE